VIQKPVLLKFKDHTIKIRPTQDESTYARKLKSKPDRGPEDMERPRTRDSGSNLYQSSYELH
jgi:hypothetical protein